MDWTTLLGVNELYYHRIYMPWGLLVPEIRNFNLQELWTVHRTNNHRKHRQPPFITTAKVHQINNN